MNYKSFPSPRDLFGPGRFFNNQNIIDKESNFLYSMGRDFIHKINLDKLSCYIPDVGYVEYYS